MTATERQQDQGQRTDVDAAFRGSATYRSLGEQQLSPAEERFERGRRTVGLFLAPVVTIVFLALPLSIPPSQQVLGGGVPEAVPIPSGGLIGVALIVIFGVAEAADVLAPFGSSTVFTFIGAF